MINDAIDTLEMRHGRLRNRKEPRRHPMKQVGITIPITDARRPVLAAEIMLDKSAGALPPASVEGSTS